MNETPGANSIRSERRILRRKEGGESSDVDDIIKKERLIEDLETDGFRRDPLIFIEEV